MKNLLSAIVASALLASPALASADQTTPSQISAPVMTHTYRIVDESGNVVGSLFAADVVAGSFRTIGHVQSPAPSAWPDVNTTQSRLLTPLDFQKAWDAQLQTISAPPAGGS
jgi:hypothetical protein